MEKNIISNTLLIVLLIANCMFILLTVKTQEDWHLIYNITIMILNILYYSLNLIPDEAL